MTHTPGPWTIQACSDHNRRFRVAGEDDRSIGTDWRDNQGLDDCRLIAAAPELLEAAKAALVGIVTAKGAREKLKAAIAKAEGGEK